MKYFTLEYSSSNLKVYQKIAFADHFKESRIKSMFSPLTVRKHQQTYGIEGSQELERIYEIEQIKPKTKVITLPGNHRKWLSIFTTFSKSRNIVFDLVGQDPIGSQKTLKYVRNFVRHGGSAILLDNFEDSESKCDRFYRIKIEE
ncbi:hypothetical protein DMA11_20840 [Marinilabiliaceae bacterium JC017]|nr:hypothetical protein DMA11_20840 [Marinilabiliaceae bacterium JC017]